MDGPTCSGGTQCQSAEVGSFSSVSFTFTPRLECKYPGAHHLLSYIDIFLYTKLLSVKTNGCQQAFIPSKRDDVIVGFDDAFEMKNSIKYNSISMQI